MRFNQYFQEWLYGKDGYYSKYKQIGKGGDFYTAVSSSKFFGGSIANKIIDTVNSGFLKENTTIVEIGAHHGYLLADIIEFIFTLKPKLTGSLKFAIVERFEHLREKQKEYFYKSFGNDINLIHYNDISELKLNSAFIVANEIFDAFSCDLVYTKDNQLQYAIVKNHNISFINCTDEELIKHCVKYKITKGEVAVEYEQFGSILAKNIKKFEFITFDYGEKYPRNDFSCRIYSKHNVYPIFEPNLKLKDFFGNSDITYDVNFSHLIDSFEKLGIKNIIYETQLKALVHFGIADLLEILHKNVEQKIYLREVNKVKTLLNPTGMGDRFKMAYFRKKENNLRV
jgi:SAM-dependent MidA family methyltransferase